MNLYNKRSKRTRGANGQSLIEFIFIIPLLFALILAAFEFTQMFIQAQKVSTLSRETTNAVFRDCSSFPDDQISSCVESSIKDIQTGADKILKNFTLGQGKMIISVYKWHIDQTNGTEAPALVYPDSGKPDKDSHIQLDTIDQTILKNQDVLVIGEILYQYTPSTIVGNLLKVITTGRLYEITIY